MVPILFLAAMIGGDPTGQVAKFDGRSPDAEYVSTTRLEDVERCLIRTGSPPQVYRQPDRPDEVTLVWTAGGVSSGNAAGRVDLKKVDGGTGVKAWLGHKQVKACAS